MGRIAANDVALSLAVALALASALASFDRALLERAAIAFVTATRHYWLKASMLPTSACPFQSAEPGHRRSQTCEAPLGI